jgi:hypothetical protein
MTAIPLSVVRLRWGIVICGNSTAQEAQQPRTRAANPRQSLDCATVYGKQMGTEQPVGNRLSLSFRIPNYHIILYNSLFCRTSPIFNEKKLQHN